MRAITRVCVFSVVFVLVAACGFDETVVVSQRDDGVSLTATGVRIGKKLFIEAKINTSGLIDPEKPNEPVEPKSSTKMVIVIDRSGSMNDESKIRDARNAANMALQKLSATDTLVLISFSDTARVDFNGLVGNGVEAQQAISNIRAIGGTALYDGLALGIEHAAHSVLLLTDGYANVGRIALEDFRALARTAAQNGVSITTVGLGSTYTEDLLREISKITDGQTFHVSDGNTSVLNGIFGECSDRAVNIALRDIWIELETRDMGSIRIVGHNAVSNSINWNSIRKHASRSVIFEVSGADAQLNSDEITVKFSYFLRDSEQRTYKTTNVVLPNDTEESYNDVRKSVAVQLFNDAEEKVVVMMDGNDAPGAQKVLQEAKAMIQETAGASALVELEEHVENLSLELNPDEWRKEQRRMMISKHADRVYNEKKTK